MNKYKEKLKTIICYCVYNNTNCDRAKFDIFAYVGIVCIFVEN